MKNKQLNPLIFQAEAGEWSVVYCWSDVSMKENMFYNIDQVMGLNIVAAASWLMISPPRFVRSSSLTGQTRHYAAQVTLTFTFHAPHWNSGMYQIRKSMQNLQTRLSAASLRQRCVVMLTLPASGIMQIYSHWFKCFFLIYQHHILSWNVVLCNTYSGEEPLKYLQW